MEMNYEFRKRLLEVHQPDIRDHSVIRQPGQMQLNDGFAIYIDAHADMVIITAAKDLQDYLFTSMGLSLPLKKVDNLCNQKNNAIVLGTTQQLGRDWNGQAVAGSFMINCSESLVEICGIDGRGAASGCYHIEDITSFVSAPVLDFCSQTYYPAFSPRLVHSGYGLDQYPDSHLSAIAHAGMDAILVFTKGVDQTPSGYQDFNELIYRAGKYGIDVYAYSYMENPYHPEDAKAQEYYESTYGRLFGRCPGLKGIVLVGESVEFPSRDPRVSNNRFRDNTDNGIPVYKPASGWWPCEDYPQWLEMLKQIIRGKKPDADIVFWTYNWGYAPEEDRVRLIKSLPGDISLMVTFEMFEERPLENMTSSCVDYTLSFAGPGRYFISEAKAAAEKGIKLYTQANSGGLTWDIGVIPYEPCPYQWIKRYDAMLEAKEKYGLSGVMESHHYGFWPSFISTLEKYMFSVPKTDGELLCTMLAKRQFGEQSYIDVLEAWKLWSEGITHYVSTNEDQYGPFRIGPAYPLVFRSDVKIPTVPYAHFGGNKICFTDYASDELYRITFHTMGRSNLLQQRLPAEIRSLERMLECFRQGGDILQQALSRLDGYRKQYGELMLNLCRFIECCTMTVINVKRWNILRALTRTETDNNKLYSVFQEMIKIGRDEIANAYNAIPCVQLDSRLGYEPSMEYIADEEHIRWKIRQVEDVIEYELPRYMSLTDGANSTGGRS